MINLNEITKQSLQNAKDRGQKTDTIHTLKHCAGEVLEAVEAYIRFVYSPKEMADNFPDELADVIMCILTICAAENIDIEKAILSCLEKNRKRAEIEREFR